MSLGTRILYPLFSLSLLCASAVAGAEKAKPESLTTFGEAVEVNVVNVDVYATDKNGKRVNDLRQGDFEVKEDGKGVAITNFVPIRLPSPGPPQAPGSQQASGGPAAAAEPAMRTPDDAWNLIVYVDNANIQPSHRTRVLRQLREFLAHSLSPGDRVMLVTSDQALKVWQPFTSDLAALDAALQGMEKVSAHGPEVDLERRNAFQAMMTIQEASLADPTDP
ncbi:MAG TPA: VWA domain-containing protein, partial [Thermoanaerobaculia bacterium]|nr:VWA domain-containing protein [Thermoanaerobaculia bacterium]